MELWIRSQDKTRLKQVKEIYFNDFDCLLDDECNCLGTYETKERALEVLDEIQNILKPQLILKSNGGAFTTGDNNLHIINPTYEKIEQLDAYVYEMPKE